MARESGSRRASRRGNSLPQQVLVMVVTFVLGYFTASIFDIETLSRWMTTQVLENHEPQQVIAQAKPKEQIPPKQKFEFYTLLANEKGVGANQAGTTHGTTATITNPHQVTAAAANSAVASATPQSARPITASVSSTATTRVAVSQSNQAISAQPKAVQVTTAKPVAPSRGANFVVQVASFKARNDAEHMKGLLILKGFEVSVVPVSTPNQGNWFRVVIGPYPNRALAQKAQVILAKTERLNGMIRST
ncbi:SPOR domain-containing protein [Legionella sp. km772]|uniref:SPOR domain-containing protein n=1 Tax=Legionella sp. km772 TaxID=2498111 RepID=UPI000F8ECA2D|nr:SPOR domain-containing protein [Legionella sp. km772]RUR08806.1 SPOR domain-containing protein [Legionella sp. km772]